MRNTFFILLFCWSSGLIAQNIAQSYVEDYAYIAINEMHRTGIPASITLAQGILESGSGQSDLAKASNNHFGIKCHKGWTGPSVSYDDDAKGECFRKYSSVADSYFDHSEFLQTRSRYAFLFDLKKDDYKGWAKGLKKAGYATNPKYASLLINLIERYDLHDYDKEQVAQVIHPHTDPIEDPVILEQEIPASLSPVFYVNRIRTTQIKVGDTPEKLAIEHGVSLNRLCKYNEIRPNSILEPGKHIFLQSKRTKAAVGYHIVQKGDNMYSISQQYGIKLEHLHKRNLIPPGAEPAVGEQLYLRKKRSEPVKRRPPEVSDNKVKPETINKEEVETTKETPAMKKPEPEKQEIKPIAEPVKKAETIELEKAVDVSQATISQNPSDNPVYYEVQKGDTFYAISKKYDVEIEWLIEWNSLQNKQLLPGQTVLVGFLEN